MCSPKMFGRLNLADRLARNEFARICAPSCKSMKVLTTDFFARKLILPAKFKFL